MVARPRVQTIAPGLPFLDALAAGLLHETRDAPHTLADYVVLLPTRRACRSLTEAFLRVSEGRPLLLPGIRPLGDVDEDTLVLRLSSAEADLSLSPEIPAFRRELLLTRLVLQWKAGRDTTPDQALTLARELARLVDQVQTERLDFRALQDLAPEQYASHWQDVLEFLAIVTDAWPKIMADEDYMDPAERRNRLLEAQAQLWRDAPPEAPVVAAGSTGSIPATADLLAVVAQLPMGRIVLPGLDRTIDETSHKSALREATHPQHGILGLLKRLEIAPADVGDWEAGPRGPEPSSPPGRTRVAIEALRPTETTDLWRSLTDLPADALDGVERVDCTNETEEAGVIALMLRQALEEPGRTAALVTPDRRIARRVAAELARWNIEIDDSAGRPVIETPPGQFLRHVVRAAADGLSPVRLLALLKHPFAAGGVERDAFRRQVRALEKRILRGPRPAPGIGGLRDCLSGIEEVAARDFGPLLESLETRLGPLCAELKAWTRPLTVLIDAHLRAAESMADDDGAPGADRLWHGDDGEQLASAIAELRGAADVLGEVSGADYAPLFEALMARATFRPRYGLHPRLHIWGPLEARLLHADLMVMAGLNERSWPPDPGNDPWMSRPMRARFGLPAPERRVGLAAHDFAQAFAASRVALVRAAKSEGAPTVPSRWLTRLATVLSAFDRKDALEPAKPWRALYRGLSNPARFVRIGPPEPRPPVAARPRELSVTRIETWMREPYAIYAERILKLHPLDPLEADPGAAERGSFIHEALDRFVREYPGELPDDALDRLVACGEAAFGSALSRPAVRAFWWPRFVRIAAWFLEQERLQRGREIAEPLSEITGRMKIPGPAGPFVLTAKADRIDRLIGGGFVIIDYKTGAPPGRKLIELGLAPQLALEALILSQGGFQDLPAVTARSLTYWRLSGGEPPGEIMPIKSDPDTLVVAARDGLEDLVRAFDDPNTPYHATPRPDHPAPFNDYEHLARTLEWSAGSGGEA